MNMNGTGNQRVVAYTNQGSLARFKPPRDRKVNSRAVKCGSCGAGVGEFCRTAERREVGNPHRERRRMALRAERAAVEALAGTEVQVTL